jgi:hypothetical protein
VHGPQREARGDGGSLDRSRLGHARVPSSRSGTGPIYSRRGGRGSPRGAGPCRKRHSFRPQVGAARLSI